MLMQCLTLYFFKKPFFSVSFSEGNQLSALDITSLIYVSRLDESNFLTMKRVEGKNIQYVLTSSDFKDLLFIEKTLKGDKNIISYQLNK